MSRTATVINPTELSILRGYMRHVVATRYLLNPGIVSPKELVSSVTPKLALKKAGHTAAHLLVLNYPAMSSLECVL